MKFKFEAFILFFFFLCLFAKFTNAQSDSSRTELYKIELKNDRVFFGAIAKQDSNFILVVTPDGLEIKIPRYLISNTQKISKQLIGATEKSIENFYKNEYWYDDPNRTRLFFAPTGRSLKAGSGYFSVYEVFFPFIAIGISDWLTLSGGMTLLPGADQQLLYFSPKVTPIQFSDFDASLGLLYIAVPNKDAAGITYGTVSYGDETAALTVGLGYGFSGSDFGKKPILVFGGETRVSKSIKFISENWIIPNSEFSLLSLGIRFFGESLASDFALIYPTNNDGDGFPFMPWIGLVYNF